MNICVRIIRFLVRNTLAFDLPPEVCTAWDIFVEVKLTTFLKR
jgi:hypothetical protein